MIQFDRSDVYDLRKNIQFLFSISLLGGRQKVEVTKFTFEEFIFVVGSAVNSVGTTLEFTAFGRCPSKKKEKQKGGARLLGLALFMSS